MSHVSPSTAQALREVGFPTRIPIVGDFVFRMFDCATLLVTEVTQDGFMVSDKSAPDGQSFFFVPSFPSFSILLPTAEDLFFLLTPFKCDNDIRVQCLAQGDGDTFLFFVHSFQDFNIWASNENLSEALASVYLLLNPVT